MCVIVDADVAHLVFGSPADADYKPVFEWIANGKGAIVYGGKLAQELFCTGKQGILVEFKRQRKAYEYTACELDPEIEDIQSEGHHRSNDAHVLALGRCSGARTLCTKDKDLIHDFKDRRIISNPRGNVYRAAAHTHLLRHCPGCVGRDR